MDDYTIDILHLNTIRHKIEICETRQSNGILIIELRFKRTPLMCPVCGSTDLRFLEYKYKKITHSISTHQSCMLLCQWIKHSVSAKGSCVVNCPIESFFSQFKSECMHLNH